MGAVNRYKAEYLVSLGQDPTPLLQKAAKHFQAAIDINPTYPIGHQGLGLAYYRMAEYLMNQGKDPLELLDRSIEILEKALTISPRFVDIHSGLGIAWWMEGTYLASKGQDPRPSYQKAVDIIKKAIDISPTMIHFYTNMGFLRMEIARYESDYGHSPIESLNKADAYFGQAQKISSRINEVFLGRVGTAEVRFRYDFMMRKDFTQKVPRVYENYRQSRDINPNFAPLYSIMAAINILQVKDQMERGIFPQDLLKQIREFQDKSLELNPAFINYYIQEAQLWIIKALWPAGGGSGYHVDALQFFNNARKALQKAYELNPRDIQAFQVRAELARNKAEWEKARGQNALQTLQEGLAALGQALEINPNYGEFWALKGVLLKLRAAMAASKALCEKDEQDARAAMQKAFQLNKNLRERY
jgi:serine/threonine-protein kinase